MIPGIANLLAEWIALAVWTAPAAVWTVRTVWSAPAVWTVPSVWTAVWRLLREDDEVAQRMTSRGQPLPGRHGLHSKRLLN